MIQFAQHPFSSITHTDVLGDEIAELSAHLDAATYRLLVLLREFDARDGWSPGFRTCAHWLSWRTGIDLGAAREKVRVARALADLPALSEALQTAVVSYSKVRALTRVATASNEVELLEVAMHGTTAHVERVVRGWRRVDRIDEAEHERERHERRGLTLFTDDDGSYVLRGRLDPEVGALLERALEMAADARSGADACSRADAIGIVAELALSAGANERAISGASADRFQVVLHVGAADDMCELDNGVRVSAETSRRLACDATRVVMKHGSAGEVLDVGRRTRTVPPALRRALEYRDRGCRFPGCGLRHCDAHHVRHWADGGVTSLENLVLLCRYHHRLVHEEGFMLAAAGGELAFHGPDGSRVHDVTVSEPMYGDVVETLRREHAGIGIHADTGALWDGTVLDADLAVRLLRE
jgi:hypothetical protein